MPAHEHCFKEKSRHVAGFFLFLRFLERNALAELLRVFLELDLALYLALVLARVIDLAGLFIAQNDELILGHGYVYRLFVVRQY